MPNLRAPILIVSGDRDEIVPAQHSDTLFKKATSSVWKDILMVEGGMHNDTWQVGGIVYVEKMNAFFTKCAELRTAHLRMHRDMQMYSAPNEAKTDL